MRLGCLSLLTLVCSQTISLIAAPAKAGEPSANDLIALAPVITSSDETIRSIEVGGYIKADKIAIFKFRAIYRAPDRHALLLSDGIDDTPLLFASDHKMLVYDPVRPAVLYATDSSTNCSVWKEGDSVTFYGGTVPNKESSIFLDLKSLFTGPSKRDEVVKTGEGKYRLTRTSERDNSLIFRIDTTIRQPFTQIDLIMKDSDTPTLCIEKIIIDGILGDREFAFPTKEQLVEKIAVRDWHRDELLKNLGGLALMYRACNARLAANQPELRDAINLLPGFWGINWDDVKKNDKKFSQLLKDVISSKP